MNAILAVLQRFGIGRLAAILGIGAGVAAVLVGISMGFGQPKALLCTCTCHESCPVAGHREVPNQDWLDGCTCPGSQRLRDIENRVQQQVRGLQGPGC